MPETLTQQELESRLWAAANSLRGPVDPSDFKAYIFPLQSAGSSGSSSPITGYRQSASSTIARTRTSPSTTDASVASR